MSSVAALAAANWAAEDYDIANAEQWEPAGRGTYFTGRFDPEEIWASADDEEWAVELSGKEVTDTTLHVHYDDQGVNVDIDGSADDRRAGALAKLDPEQAKEVAAAIYMAAEEQARRPWADR